MKALVVTPKTSHSGRIEEVPEPSELDGDVLCEMVAVGVCGTDREILSGRYGEAPEGEERLVIGHESLGRVLEAPSRSNLKPGDLVVGIVRRLDPVPCDCCARGEYDMCRNGLYTERGIKGRHGFASERFRIEADYAIKIDPSLGLLGVLLEPASIVAKAWEQCLRISGRASLSPQKALVAGAGPVGLLATLLGRQNGFEMHVFDRATEGLKPDLVRELGAAYHTDLDAIPRLCETFDIVLECTGAPEVIAKLATNITPTGILCLTGVSSGGRSFTFDLGEWNRKVVLENAVVFGTVSANRRHFELAQASLARANHDWLEKLITRRAPLEHWHDAFERGEEVVKNVIVSRSIQAESQARPS